MKHAVSLLLFAFVACKSSPSPPQSKTVVRPWTEIPVPGVKIFTTHVDPAPADYDYRGAFLQHEVDAKRKLQGQDAMRVVAAKGISDPAQLAVFSQLFLDRIGAPIVSSPDQAQGSPKASEVEPPAIRDGVLVYWHWSGGMTHMLQRSRVNLTTWERETQ
jgi:hypothetical protein